MTRNIKEAFKLNAEGGQVQCSICTELTYYYDILDKEAISCPVCSYKYNFEQDVKTVQHLTIFNPADPHLMEILVKIAEYDKLKSVMDPECIFELVLSSEIRDRLLELALEQKTGMNEIVIAGLSWFISLVNQSKSG